MPVRDARSRGEVQWHGAARRALVARVGAQARARSTRGQSSSTWSARLTAGSKSACCIRCGPAKCKSPPSPLKRSSTTTTFPPQPVQGCERTRQLEVPAMRPKATRIKRGAPIRPITRGAIFGSRSPMSACAVARGQGLVTRRL